MMSPDNSEVKQAVEMAELKSGMSNIQKDIAQINQTLQELVKIDARMSQVSLQNQNIQTEMLTVWKKHDTLVEWKDGVDQQLNRAHGARSIIILVVSFIQVLAISIGGYVAVELIRTQRLNDVQDARLSYLEQRIK